MDRNGHNILMSGAKFKPGDLVWTYDETFGPWPGKVLQLSDEILSLYPDTSQILHYVELYGKDRDFYFEDDLWPFYKQGKIAAICEYDRFASAVKAAREDEDSNIFEIPQGSQIENATFCKRRFLRYQRSQDYCNNSLVGADLDGYFHSVTAKVFDISLQKPCTQTNPMYHVPAFQVGSSIVDMFQNQDLFQSDVYEVTESEPMASNVEEIPNVENFAENVTRSQKENTALDANLWVQVPSSEQISDSSLSPNHVPMNLGTKETNSLTENDVSLRKAEHEIHITSIGNSSKLELTTQSEASNVCGKEKASQLKRKASTSRRRKGSKKRRSTKNLTTAVEKESNDLPTESTEKESDELSVGSILPTPEVQTDSALRMLKYIQLDPKAPMPGQNFCVGFLGLGAMGKRIVSNLLAYGRQVVLWNRSLHKCYDMSRFGACVLNTPADVINSCNVTFCCVSDASAVKEVYSSSNGVGNAKLNGKVFVVLTTIDPKASKEIEEDILAKGGFYFEAPLSPAKDEDVGNNSLMTVVAGDASVIELCLPYFSCFIKDFIFAGDVPKANTMMLLMKALSGVEIASLAEGMALATKCQLPLDTLCEIITDSQLASPFLIEKANAMLHAENLSETDEGKFPLRHFSNDLSSALNIDSELHTPVIAAAKQAFVLSKAQGFSNLDVSAVLLRHLDPRKRLREQEDI